MSSILTNNSAMVALDTLRGINKNLGNVQNEISTGKKISSSTDNAAIWSISTVMQADVTSFAQVSDSLNLGAATVGVAQNGAETVTDILTEAKAAIVAANDPSVSDTDRAKYQTDLTELTATVGSIVDAASFNGTNLLKGTESIAILSSLNRQSDGTVEAGTVTVERQDLSTTAAVDAVVASAAVDAVAAVAGGVAAGGEDGNLDVGTAAPADGATSLITIDGGSEAVTEGSTYEIDIDGTSFEYTALADDDINDVNAGLVALIDADGDFSAAVTTPAADAAVNDSTFTITNDSGAGVTAITSTATIAAVTAVDAADAVEASDAVAAGGLAALATIDISTEAGATAGLAAIDALLQTAIDATAQFGSKTTRINNQNEFITTLSDSLKTGIGAMTDSNLEEASARLQSLQVQQQLGVQSLSIANQAPQQLLALFR